MKEKTVLTGLMLSEYPHFMQILSEIILNKFKDQSKQTADVMIGIDDIGLSLAFCTAQMLNTQRAELGQKTCHATYARYNKRGVFSQFMHGKVILIKSVERLQRNDNVVFVHCLFDNPIGHPTEAPWKYGVDAKNQYELSCLMRNPKQVKKIIGRLGGKIIQSIILPIPYEEYEKFMAQ